VKTYQLYIDGQSVDPVEGSWFESIDPYRGEPWARIPRAGRADVDRAVAAAKRAMWDGPWATMTASARGKVLRRIGDLVEREARALAEVEVRDNGKLFGYSFCTLERIGGTPCLLVGLASVKRAPIQPIGTAPRETALIAL